MNRSIPTFDDTTNESATDPRAGFGVLETPRGRLPLIALDVRTRISDVTAETTVRQTFRNALDEPLEATYIFPLPDRAAVTSFKMHVAGRTIDGLLKERGEAREEYDRAIQQGHRAAIAEEDRSGVFNLRVGNLPPHEEAVVELTLVGPLAVSDGEATFRFPLVVAPRYTPGVPLDGPSVGAGVAPDTDEVPDASRVTPPVLLPGFPNPVRLSLEVQLDPAAVGVDESTWRERVKSSLHSTIADEGPPWTVRLQPAERLNRDFILRFPVAAQSVVTSLRVSPESDGKPGVFSLTLLPPAMSQVALPPREIVFVLDRSGSMSGWKMVAARRALGRMIDTLLEQDRFTVLAFDNVVEQPPSVQKKTFLTGTNRQRWEVLEWLGGINARGGTEMGAAIDRAMQLFSASASNRHADPSTASSYLPILVIVTDGQVSGEDAILRRLGKVGVVPRIFTVGIDQSVNAGFLRRLADRGNGNCELVESEERLDDAMSRIHRLIGTPVVTGVRLEPINFDLIADSVAPKRLPDLFADRPVTIFGRHLANDPAIRLRVHAVDANGNARCEEVAGRLDSPTLLISTWGRAMVRDLEDEYAIGNWKDSKRLTERIVQVSLESHVLSRFTAYVAVDRCEVINQHGQLHSVVQPVEMPEGWDIRSLASMSIAASASRSANVFRKYRSASPPEMPSMSSDLTDDVDFRGETVDSMLQEFTDTAISFTETDEELLSDVSPAAGGSSPVIRLVQLLFTEAVQLGATEIRIEPGATGIQVHFRINGELVLRDSPPLAMLNAIVDRILALANLDLARRQFPQQGQLTAVVNATAYVWDVNTLNKTHGTSVVMKLNSAAGKAQEKEKSQPNRRKKFWS